MFYSVVLLTFCANIYYLRSKFDYLCTCEYHHHTTWPVHEGKRSLPRELSPLLSRHCHHVDTRNQETVEKNKLSDMIPYLQSPILFCFDDACDSEP